MKLSLSLLAAGAAASRVAQDNWDSCYSDWIWEECSWSYYQEDYCTDECGWWYSDAESLAYWENDLWISCEEFDTWWWCGGGEFYNYECYSDWYWEECSGFYYQEDYCNDDCGWWYSPAADLDWDDDWWVTCDEFAEWEECSIIDDNCDYAFFWDECWAKWYRHPCGFEELFDDYPNGALVFTDDDETEYWVDIDLWNSECN